MKAIRKTLAAAIGLWLASATVLAADIEGVVESLDPAVQALVVSGVTFYVSDETEYDDGLSRFEDLREGQKVEVDYYIHDGRHHATEIELDE